MYYVPGFSNYLQKIAEPEPYAEDTSGYDAPAFYGYDAPAYYTLPASDYGMAAPQQATPSVSYDYAPASDYGMVMPQQATPSVSYDYAPASDYGMYDGGGLSQAYSEPAYQSLPADTSTMVPAADYGMSAQSAPVAQATQAPVGALSYTSDPNMTLEQFLAASAQAPSAQMPSTRTVEHYLAASHNAGLPENLRYTSTTQTLNPNYDPNATFSLPPGSEFTMTDQERRDAYTRWVLNNQKYQTKSWMVDTKPSGYGSVHMELQSGSPYVLVNTKTGETIAQGSDDATLERMANTINSGSLGNEWQLFQPDAYQSADLGYGAHRYVEGSNGQPGYWLNAVAGATPPPSLVGQLLKGALSVWGLPIAGAYLGPAIAGGLGVSSGVGAGLAGAVTGAAGSAITGGDILKGALLGGAAGFGLNQLASAVGPGATPGGGGGSGGSPGSSSFGPEGITVVGSSVPTFIAPSLSYGGGKVPTDVNTSDLKNGALPTSVDTTGINPMEFAPPTIDASAVDVGGALPSANPNQIVVSAAPSGGLSMASAVSPAIAQLGLDIATNPAQYEQAIQQAQQEQAVQQTEQPGTVVYASNTPVPGPITLPVPITSAPAPSGLDAVDVNDIIVNAAKANNTAGAPAPLTGGLSGPVVGGVDQATGEIVAEAPRKPPETLAPVYDFGFGQGGAGTTVQQPTLSQPEPTTTQQPKSTLDTIKDIADYMQLAGLGIGAIGSLFGGGQKTAATIANASGLGGLNSTFNAKLPGANIPGLGGITVGSGPRTAADLGQQGMTSPQDYYRYGYGPEQSFFGYVPQGAPNTSKAYTGYAKGGFAVEGPGDGREDKIPAMLSDGEYVMDAETVALLGNGSNKAGADMLDKFRVKVRKHKGRELARGKFSKNAKRPEQYLAGGRS